MTDIYVRFFHRPGSTAWSRMRIGLQPNIRPPRKKAKGKGTGRSSTPKQSQNQYFKSAIDQYVEALKVIQTSFAPAIRAVPPYTDEQFSKKAKEILGRRNGLIKKTKDGDIYKIDEAQAVQLVEEYERKVEIMRYILYAPKFFIIGIVALYDDYLGKLISDYLHVVPESVNNSQKTISYKELTEFPDLEAAQEHIIDKEAEAVIRESHIAQFDWLEKKLGIPLRKDLDNWPKFVEICERRNLLTHSNGRVNMQYISICQQHRADTRDIHVGSILDVPISYLQESVNVFLGVGIKLGHVMWRKVMPDDAADADSSLSGICYDLIRQKKYGTAKDILDFAVKMPNISSEELRRILIVNRANAHKLDGDSKKAIEILNQEDWSASDLKFKISVAAVRDDDILTLELMSKIGRSGAVGPEDYREWPVFEKIRGEETFRARFTEIFGAPLVPESSTRG